MAKTEEKKQDKKEEVVGSEDDLATAITRISDSMKRLTRSGLNFDAIVALIHDDTGLAKTKIVGVLTSLKDLHRKYCR